MNYPISVDLNLVDDKQGKVDIHLHQFQLGDRERHCWTYITRGLSRDNQSQREMALSLLVEEGADTREYPRTPIRMFRLLAEKIKEGQQLQHGDATKLGQKGIFGFPCLFYVPAVQFETLPPLDQHLALILVHQSEYDYARQFGVTRFLSRLGRFCSSFPYPTWNTEIRPDIFESSEDEISLLTYSDHQAIDQSHINLSARTLRFEVFKEDAGAVVESLKQAKPGSTVLFNTAYSPGCDASLYWQEDQQTPGAFSAPETPQQDAIIGGSFLALSQAQAAGKRSHLSIVEDGFHIRLDAAEWRALVTAATAGDSFETQLTEWFRFRMNLLEATSSPIARPYFHQAVWRDLSYLSRASGNTPANPDPFINLSGKQQPDVVDRLTDYVEALSETIIEAMSEEQASFRFALELTFDADQVREVVQSATELNPAFVEFISAVINNVEGTVEPVKPTIPVKIRLPFRVNC